MNEVFFPAIFTGFVSIIVVLLTQGLIRWRENSEKRQNTKQQMELLYLNPLRFYLAEVHLRFSVILDEIERSNEHQCKSLIVYASSPEDLLDKADIWFNEEGCYLASTCYLTGCLLASFERIRVEIPYMKLNQNDSLKLLSLINKVAFGFRAELGIYYVLQFNVGNELLEDNGNKIISYRKFCGKLRDPDDAAWLERLVKFHAEIGQGYHLEQTRAVQQSIVELLNYTEKIIGGGSLLKERYLLEDKINLLATVTTR